MFKQLFFFLFLYLSLVGAVSAGFYNQVYGDFGGKDILKDVPENLTGNTLGAGKGAGILAGWEHNFRRDGDVLARYAVQVAAGYKFQMGKTTNYAEYIRSSWPLEVFLLRQPALSSFRYGLGMQYEMGGSLKGKGSWALVDRQYRSSAGVALKAEYHPLSEFSAGVTVGFKQFTEIGTGNFYPALTMGLGITYFYAE